MAPSFTGVGAPSLGSPGSTTDIALQKGAIVLKGADVFHPGLVLGPRDLFHSMILYKGPKWNGSMNSMSGDRYIHKQESIPVGCIPPAFPSSMACHNSYFQSRVSRALPKVDHCGNDARIVLDLKKFSKKLLPTGIEPESL